MAEFYQIVGGRVRALREKRNMTREELAEAANISPQFLANVENGARGISAKTALGLAQGLQVSTDYLLTGTERLDPVMLAAEAIASLNADQREFDAESLYAIANIMLKSREEK